MITLRPNEREYIQADADELKSVLNVGPTPAYYGNRTVSVIAYDGALAVGQSMTLAHGAWFVSAGTNLAAEQLPGGQPVLSEPDVTGLLNLIDDLQADVAQVEAGLAAKQSLGEKGVPDGYAGLDGAGKLVIGQMPVSALVYRGTWNAATNTPTLVAGTGAQGDLWRVTNAGTVDFGAGNVAFDVGDYAIYNGTTWERSDNLDSVTSVAGRTGTVTLTQTDVGLGNVDNTADAAKPVSSVQQTEFDVDRSRLSDIEDGSTWPDQEDGYVLSVAGGVPTWADPGPPEFIDGGVADQTFDGEIDGGTA